MFNNKKMKAKSLILIIVIVAAVITIAAVIKTYPWAKEKADEVEEKDSVASETSKSELELSDLSTANYTYSLEEIPWGMETGFSGQKLIRENKETGEKETVIENVKDKVPEIQNEEFGGLLLVAHPDNSNEIFFTPSTMHSEKTLGGLLAYDIARGNFIKMNSSEKFKGSGISEASPNQSHIFFVQNRSNEGLDQEMHIFDLMNDSFETIKLEDDETFNSGRYAMGAYWDISWIDDNTLKCAVYDQSEKSDSDYDPENETSRQSTFIEYREFKIE